MGSQRRGTVLAKEATHQSAGNPSKSKKKMAETLRWPESDEEKLRQQVRKTLWQAAISGRLENIFPKGAKPATDSSGTLGKGMGNLPDDKSESSQMPSEPAAIEGLEDAPVDAALANSGRNISDSPAKVDMTLEQLRKQARQTFCQAIVTGKLDKVLGQARGDPVDTKAENLSSAPDIRNQVRATLEKASRNGHLSEVLAQHRGAKSNQHDRFSQARRYQQLEKKEDTRDLDQLLLEIGEAPAQKAGKTKKKVKKSVVASDATGDGFKDNAADLVDDKVQQLTIPKPTLQSAKLNDKSSPQSSACTKSLGNGSGVQQDGQLLEGWHRVPAKCARRPTASCDTSATSSTASCDLSATSDSWVMLEPSSPALEPIVRKAPVAPTSMMLSRPALAEAPKHEAKVPSTRSTKHSAKRHALPPPPSNLPPPPPETDCQGYEHKETEEPQAQDGVLQPTEPMRSIQIWPDTPESTPPSSPRIGWGEKNEVLVPVPIHLLAEVQRLLMAGGMPHTATMPPLTFGELAA